MPAARTQGNTRISDFSLRSLALAIWSDADIRPLLNSLAKKKKSCGRVPPNRYPHRNGVHIALNDKKFGDFFTAFLPMSNWSNNDRLCFFFCLIDCMCADFYVFVCLLVWSFLFLLYSYSSLPCIIKRHILYLSWIDNWNENIKKRSLLVLHYCTSVSQMWLKKTMTISAVIAELQPEFEFVIHNSDMPIPVAVRSKVWVCRLLTTRIIGSNPNRDMDVRLLCLYVFWG